ncbi:MAG: flagellar biosynthetic protein FliO [Treponema sp.]|nr:flagellar biosynthetic protein FliO [Treponema sp.]
MFTNARKVRTAVLLLLVVCFYNPVVLSAQDASPETAGQTALSFSTDQSTILLPQSQAVEQAKSPSSVWLFVRMVFVLALVVALIYGVLRFMRKTQTVSDTDDPFLRRVASLSLGQGKSVQVVTLLDHAYIVGVSDSGVQPIGEVTDKELVDSMNLFADKNSQTKKPRNFSDVLELFMPMSGRGSPSGPAPVQERMDSSQSFATGPAYGPEAFNPDESIESAERRAHTRETSSEGRESPASSISRLRSRLNNGFSGGDGNA